MLLTLMEYKGVCPLNLKTFQGKEEEEEDFETLEDIANFINSSEPLQKERSHPFKKYLFIFLDLVFWQCSVGSVFFGALGSGSAICTDPDPFHQQAKK
jgi:hypothetical protein